MGTRLAAIVVLLSCAVPLVLPAQEKPSAKPSQDKPPSGELPVQAALRLRSVIRDMFLSADGASLYALDLSEAKVYRIATKTMTVAEQVDAVENAVAMAMTADGKTLYVAANRPRGIKSYDDRGTIQQISVNPFKSAATFEVALSIVDLEATNSGVIVVGAYGHPDGQCVLIDVPNKSILGAAHTIDCPRYLKLHPDQSRTYMGDSGVSPADFHCLPLRRSEQGGYKPYDSPYHGEHPLGGDFEITPDGRYLIGCRGAVLRLAKTKDADMRFVGKIDPCLSIGLARGSDTFVTSNREGFLKIYDAGDLELKKSVKVGKCLRNLALDPQTKTLYAFACPVSPERGSDSSVIRAGDIVSFSLKGE